MPGPDAVRLDGSSGGRLVRRTLAYHELAGIRIGRSPDELLGERPKIVVERAAEPALLVQPLGPGLLLELAGLLAELCTVGSGPVEQVALVLPLRPGGLEVARMLVEQGPPFDPADKVLARHTVFLTDAEAIFVFSGSDSCESVRRIVADPAVWPLAEVWASCMGDPPRLAEAGFAWSEPRNG